MRQNRHFWAISLENKHHGTFTVDVNLKSGTSLMLSSISTENVYTYSILYRSPQIDQISYYNELF